MQLCKSLAVIVCLASALPIRGGTPESPVRFPAKPATLDEAFGNPPQEARASCYWWWKGKLTADEMGRQLRLLKNAGLGGAHIVPWDSEPAYLTPEWLEILKAAVEAARKEQMVLDLSANAKWPFRGDWVPADESLRKLTVETVEVEGPKAWSLPANTRKKSAKTREGAEAAIYQAQLAPVPLTDVAQLRDVTSEFKATGAVKVPPGQHRLYLVKLATDLKKTAYGSVPDHFNREAVENYLNGFRKRLAPATGDKLGDSFRALYCDSIELSEANWTPSFAQEFRERCGYDLAPYLPLVLSIDPRDKPPAQLPEPLNQKIRRVRYDYCRTLTDLFQESLPGPFNRWCHANGVQCRWQAYGWPWFYGIDDGYRVPDIPEGNSWLFTGSVFHGDVDMIGWPIWQKYASSGAHQTGRQITSTESMTVVEGKFKETLDLIKRADDFNFVSGINHSFLHGFCYSPADEPFPGRDQYGTYFSEHNPWWPYMRRWMDYNARLSAVFQAAKPVAQVALLFRNADIWSDAGLHRHPFQLDPPWAHQVWRWISQNGATADYISDRALLGATFEKGSIQFGPMRYRALIVLGVNTMDPATADALARYAKSGGKIAFIGALPDRSPGLTNAGANDAKVKETVRSLIANYPDTVVERQAPGKTGPLTGTRSWLEILDDWRASTSPAECLRWTDGLLRQLGIERSARLDTPVAGLYQIHYRGDANRNVHFFANTLDREISARVDLGGSGTHVERWDTETGERSGLRADPDGRFSLSLPSASSILLVAGPGKPSDQKQRPPQRLVQIPLTNEWSVVFAPADGASFQLSPFTLCSFDQCADPRLNRFAGTATYRTTFTWNSEEKRRLNLDLGSVLNCVSEARLNGQPLGVRWHGPAKFAPEASLKRGENQLEIKVVTTLWNRLRKQEEPAEPSGLKGPVKLSAEAAP